MSRAVVKTVRTKFSKKTEMEPVGEVGDKYLLDENEDDFDLRAIRTSKDLLEHEENDND